MLHPSGMSERPNKCYDHRTKRPTVAALYPGEFSIRIGRKVNASHCAHLG